MRKLELNVHELRVESFETLPARGSVGTVLANVFGNPLDPFGAMDEADAATNQTAAGWDTCGGNGTCNFQAGCYTWNGGFTCAGQQGCNPTHNQTGCTCTCVQDATAPEDGV